MNDHDAMTAINKVLDQHYNGAIDPYAAVQSIARISGLNAIEHAAAEAQS
jgi:hypothetical protein